MGLPFSLSLDEQRLLGQLAVSTIDNALHGIEPVLPCAGDFPESLHAHLGCFVTLTIQGQLRGCMGLIRADETPLYENIWRMALFAAFKDPRFRQLSLPEWAHTAVEINVLGPLSPCPDVRQIVIGKHGLVLSLNGRTGVFLPSVPVEFGWDLDQYLLHLCDKAGLPAFSWQDEGARLDWYESFSFDVQR